MPIRFFFVCVDVALLYIHLLYIISVCCIIFFMYFLDRENKNLNKYEELVNLNEIFFVKKKKFFHFFPA